MQGVIRWERRSTLPELIFVLTVALSLIFNTPLAGQASDQDSKGLILAITPDLPRSGDSRQAGGREIQALISVYDGTADVAPAYLIRFDASRLTPLGIKTALQVLELALRDGALSSNRVLAVPVLPPPATAIEGATGFGQLLGTLRGTPQRELVGVGQVRWVWFDSISSALATGG